MGWLEVRAALRRLGVVGDDGVHGAKFFCTGASGYLALKATRFFNSDVDMFFVLLLAALARPCLCSLVSDNAWFLNESTHARVSLHCVGFRDLAVASFLGANCVRYASDEHEQWASRIGNITSSGLVPVLAYEGATQTREWVETLENLTSAHRFALVDIGAPTEPNTWGHSTDFFRDWMAAATTVCFRLHRIDPAVMISVGAFCGLDLRRMMRNVGPGDAFERGKLAYSVRLVPSMFWWDGDWVYALSLASMVLSFGLAVAGCSLYEVRYAAYGALGNSRKHEFRLAVAASMLFHVAVIFGTTLLLVAMSGCRSVADDVSWVLVLAACCTVLSSAYINYVDCGSRAFCAMCCFWASLYFLLVGAFAMYLLTPASYQGFLDLMALEGRPVPVWAARLDVRDPDAPSFWAAWQYVGRRYDLDYAWGNLDGSVLPRLWANTMT